MQRHSSLTQQLGERWLTLMNRLQEDPKMAQVMSTKTGQYLRRRPFLALALLLFSAMAALPVGLFLLFALITIVMSVVGFVFFEGTLQHLKLNNVFLFFFSFYVKLILILPFSVSAVSWRNDSAVCALRHRPLLPGGLDHRYRCVRHHSQPAEELLPSCDKEEGE